MKKLKIIHIVSSLNVGGAERFVIDLSQSIKEHHQVEILSFGSEQDTLYKVARSHNIDVTNIPNSSSLLGQTHLFKKLSSCDVIHLHTPRVIKTLSIVLKLIGKKRIIYTRHGAAALSSKQWQNLHSKFKKYVSHMTFVSQEGMDIFTQTYPWPDIAKEVVDNGVVTPELSKKSDDEVLKVGSVGRFVALKNQMCLLKAVHILPDELRGKVEVHLFGDGECKQALQDFVEKNALSKQVVFHGMVENRETIYNAFDVMCVTSETEGLSLAIMEAMAFQLPVIATDVGGNSKLVKDGINGWLFNYDDTQALSKQLACLVNNRNLLTTYGEKAREYIIENFSIKNAVSKYINLYEG